MRSLALVLLMAAPAAAQDAPQGGSAYDDTILTGCLDRVAAQAEGTATAADLRKCIGIASDTCMQEPSAMTTVGMVMCLREETKQWDMLLNAHYAKAIADAEEGDKAIAEMDSAAEPVAPILRQAQRNWIGFRDESCRYESLRFYGGTAGGPASGSCMLQLTAEQALRLRDVARGWGE